VSSPRASRCCHVAVANEVSDTASLFEVDLDRHRGGKPQR
jgi:hypothetical protein